MHYFTLSSYLLFQKQDDAQYQKFFKTLDVDGDNVVDYKEFMVFVTSLFLIIQDAA